MYLFFDEIQRVDAWEDAVNALRVDLDCDIYVTGSNAYLLSTEYSTYLSGRCVEIKMLPLSFSEFLYFHDFEVKETRSALGGVHKRVFDKNGEQYELREAFEAFMRFGGMPGIADVGLDQEKALSILDGIYSTVVVRDILEREKRRGQKRITDPILLRKIIMFLAGNIGSNVSIASIGKNAFRGCSKLKTVKTGAAITEIKDGAFLGCTVLTSITIPARVTRIGKQAFYNCKKLKTITVKTKKLVLKKVGKKAFTGISSKAVIKVPGSKKKAYKTLFRKRGRARRQRSDSEKLLHEKGHFGNG